MKTSFARSCYAVEITTPTGVLLNGLWFGPKKAGKLIIVVHGLTGSLFSMKRMVEALLGGNTAVLVFNNRGFEQVTEVKRGRGKKASWIRGGGGHEVFTDCADDIQGAVNFARKAKIKNIYIAGHSTGCQKAVYWAAKHKGGRGVRGLILFGPLSDYAIAIEEDRGGKLAKSVAYARALVRKGTPHALIPRALGPWFVCDAQRFLSLYTPDSPEELFTYAQPKKTPRALRSVRVPVLVLFAGKEEHTKRPAKELASWFEKNIRAPHRVLVIPKVTHSFKGGEGITAGAVRKFMKQF